MLSLFADCYHDMGPGAGIHGGEVIAADSERNHGAAHSVTGSYRRPLYPGRTTFQLPKGTISVSNGKYNLQHISVDIPTECARFRLPGPSGSGKSTLIFEVPAKGNQSTEQNRVSGLSVSTDQEIDNPLSPE